MSLFMKMLGMLPIGDDDPRWLDDMRCDGPARATSTAADCFHSRTIEQPGDETFHPRLGCLDCDTWLQPVRLRKS